VASILVEREVRRAWLVGGGQLAGSFRAAQLITEYVVTVLPVVLGGGTPLFAVPGPREELRLMETRKFSGGLVQMRYRR
jgi:dihydrofolate reductase